MALMLPDDSKCAICHISLTRKNFASDHCHQSGRSRALLCRHCNVGLGMFKDNPTRLRAAARYVEAFRSHETPAEFIARNYALHPRAKRNVALSLAKK